MCLSVVMKLRYDYKLTNQVNLSKSVQGLARSPQGNSKVQREHGATIPRRATARVPTPLHTAPALTMKTKGASPARSHCKGGGGVERGGDPCGRPGRNLPARRRLFAQLPTLNSNGFNHAL